MSVLNVCSLKWYRPNGLDGKAGRFVGSDPPPPEARYNLEHVIKEQTLMNRLTTLVFPAAILASLFVISSVVEAERSTRQAAGRTLPAPSAPCT